MAAFIIIEGPDFCGKSTQIRLLQEIYSDNINILFTREPGSFLPNSTKECEAIRQQILFEDNTLLEEAKLFAQSRLIHTKDIIDLLKDNHSIISDRYIISSLAYQGYSQKLNKDTIYELNKETIDLLKENNIQVHCIKFEISEDVWRNRKRARMSHSDLDMIEKKDIHDTVLEFFSNKDIYSEWTKNLNIITHSINCDRDIYSINQDLIKLINELI